MILFVWILMQPSNSTKKDAYLLVPSVHGPFQLQNLYLIEFPRLPSLHLSAWEPFEVFYERIPQPQPWKWLSPDGDPKVSARTFGNSTTSPPFQMKEYGHTWGGETIYYGLEELDLWKLQTEGVAARGLVAWQELTSWKVLTTLALPLVSRFCTLKGTFTWK